ncbi:MAG: hypothetical protein Q4A98_04885 [Comamonadaceae bacterium]|nr:hypothetical protein [Comamonadaceae bacterium]
MKWAEANFTHTPIVANKKVARTIQSACMVLPGAKGGECRGLCSGRAGGSGQKRQARRACQSLPNHRKSNLIAIKPKQGGFFAFELQFMEYGIAIQRKWRLLQKLPFFSH